MNRLVIALVFLLGLAPEAAACVSGPQAQLVFARARMRGLGRILEAYHIDLGAFPPSSGAPAWQMVNPGHPSLEHAVGEIDPAKVRQPPPEERAQRFLSVFVLAVAGFLVLIYVRQRILELKSGNAHNAKWSGAVHLMTRSMTALQVLLVITAGASVVMAFVGGDDCAEEDRIHPEWEGRPLGFRYWTDGSHWILQSVGPDGVHDLTDLSTVPLASREATEAQLIPLTYDPTNGTPSTGDIFRTTYWMPDR